MVPDLTTPCEGELWDGDDYSDEEYDSGESFTDDNAYDFDCFFD
jgi:hypothetical protein